MTKIDLGHHKGALFGMIRDRPLVGIIFMLGFCLFAPMSDAATKNIAVTTPLIVLLYARYAAQWLMPLFVIVITRRKLQMSRRVLRILLIRCLVHIGGLAAMFAAFRYLPLADAIAIAFVFPFIQLLLGHWFLGEHVGIRRLSACSVGFIGTLFIIQPSFAEVGLPALLPLLVAFLFAVLVFMTRQIAKDYDPLCLQSTSGLVGLVILTVVGLTLGDVGIFDLQLQMPPASAWGTLFLIGLFGTLAHIAMTYAVRFAPSTTLAPMQYVEIPIATFLGWVFFDDLPNGLAAIGILITVSAGLAVIYFEHRANRATSVPSPLSPDG